MNFTEKIINAIEKLKESEVAELTGKPEDKPVGNIEIPSAMATLILTAAENQGAPALFFGGELNLFNGKHYESMEASYTDIAKVCLKKLGRPHSLALDGGIRRNTMQSLKSGAEVTPEHNIVPRGINFQDGVLWMSQEEFEFVPMHDPKDVFTYALPFNYMGDRQPSKVWSRFIKQVAPDEEYRNYILASLANAIACDPMQAQRMLLLMGVGATGKSTLIDAVAATVGKSNVCRVDDLRNLTKDDSRHRLGLANNILCICGDASGNIGNKDVLKQIISKEELSGRKLFTEVEYFMPRASLVVASNEIGFTHALGDSGISRRIDIIEFNEQIPETERDPFISRKLAEPNEQREMVFDMIIQLGNMMREHGKMVRPERISLSLEMLRVDGDPFLAFLSSAGICRALPSDMGEDVEWIHQNDLKRAFTYYCQTNGYAAMSTRTVKAKCRANSIESRSAKAGTHRFKFLVTDAEAKNKAFLL